MKSFLFFIYFIITILIFLFKFISIKNFINNYKKITFKRVHEKFIELVESKNFVPKATHAIKITYSFLTNY